MLTLSTIVKRVTTELQYGCTYSERELRDRHFFTLWTNSSLVMLWETIKYDKEVWTLQGQSREVKEVLRNAIQIEMDSRLPK